MLKALRTSTCCHKPAVIASLLIAAASTLVPDQGRAQQYIPEAIDCYQAAARRAGNFPELCRAAAEKGDAHAMYLLGSRSTNLERRIDWFEQAVARQHPRAASELAEIRRRQGDNARANELDRLAARIGYGPSRIRIAQSLRADRDNADNVALARRIFIEEAIAGYPQAQYLAAVMLANGEGGEADPEQAEAWLFEAASSGLVQAQVEYGMLLVDSEPNAAVTWLQKAARGGSARAMYALSVLFGNSLTSEQNLGRARYWAHLAVRAGHPRAPQFLAQLAQASVGNSGQAAQAGAGQASQSGPAEVPEVRRAIARLPNTVARVQQALTLMGYEPGPVDGMMGERTRGAISEFQRSIGATETGNADENVLEQMLRVIESRQ